ncbi:MAG: hypothetical protein KatS3mg090_0749 [Patescibacteria group bacterium]|nr:MAG: hypothetical protein KatS3mg090_0749 [Patescibacteria group bacterium]
MEEFNNQENTSKATVLYKIVKTNYAFLALIILVLVSISVFLYYRWSNNQDEAITVSEQEVFLDTASESKESNADEKFAQEAESYEALGSIYTYSDKESVSVNENIETFIVLNSNNTDITGFDVVVNYDPNVLKFLDIGNFLAKRLDIIYQDNSGVITISAVKKLSDKDQLVFNDEDVLVLRFQALKPGETSVSVVRSSEFGITQFVDSQNKVFTPNVAGLSLKVE